MKLSHFLAIALVTACQGGGASRGSKNPLEGAIQPLPENTVILEYEGGKITAKDVSQFVDPELKRMREEILEAYKRAGERALVTKLVEAEAKKQNLPNAEALISQVAQKTEVTDAEIEKFMKDNKLTGGVTDPATGKKRKVSKDEIKGHLEGQKRQGTVQAYIQGLMANAKVKPVLEGPKTELKGFDEEASFGPKDAKVVIYEFSDFQCPFCSRGKASVDAIKKAYPDKVRVVFRHFPLNFHPEAKPSAFASHCAMKEGKFWEMHDKLFDNQKDLNSANYSKWAKELGLDLAKFEACLKDEATAKIVERDMAQAEEVGVNSTPTFFINGNKIAGALPFERFQALIEQELAK